MAAEVNGQFEHQAARPSFADFDQRGYRTVSATAGYGDWAATYEDTVHDGMDIALLSQIRTVNWARGYQVADLGCGTGRIGQWLHLQGITAVDGVDLAPAMLARAEVSKVYRSLRIGDVTATSLASGTYDVVTVSLVDEHLADLEPLYMEASRLVVTGGALVLVGYHPQFIMVSGMPTHYTSTDGEPVAIETHLHLLSDHVTAGLQAGWTLIDMKEQLIDDQWIVRKPKWERFRGQPFTFVMAWQKR